PTSDGRRDERRRARRDMAALRAPGRGRHAPACPVRRGRACVDAGLPAGDPRPDRRAAAATAGDAGRVASRPMETLLDLLAEAVAANRDKTALSLRLDDGTTATWSYRELERGSRLAAWRLRALGL